MSRARTGIGEDFIDARDVARANVAALDAPALPSCVYTIASGRIWHGELRNRAKDGSHYWVDTTIVPFLDERHHPYQYISIRYDITERKATEARLREQASLAQLGRMAAVVAHEVRNPLAGIRGALQVIGQRMAPEAPEKGIVTEIVNRVDTLNVVVIEALKRDLLQLKRYPEAVDLLEGLVRRTPDDINLIGQLGAVHAQAGDTKAATDAWERAAAIAPAKAGTCGIQPFHQAPTPWGTCWACSAR